MTSRAFGWDRECSEHILRCWSNGNSRNTCVWYSLLADSLPRWWYLEGPEVLGQGGDAAGEGGDRGGGLKEATPVQPASQTGSQPAQQRVPSASGGSANAIRAFLFLCLRFI